METKLTLRMDIKLIDAAKLYAEKQGVSLSKLVADYFQIVAVKKSKNGEAFQPTPILAEITGVLKNDLEDKDWRKEYHHYLEGKYL